MLAWFRSWLQGWHVFLAAGLGLCVWAGLMGASPEPAPQPQQAQVLRGAQAAAVPGARLPTQAQASALDAQRERPSSPDLLQEVAQGSRLSTHWLQTHGFSAGSEGLKRLHGLMDGHTQLSAPGTTHVAFGPQGKASGSGAKDIPVLSAQERYVQAEITLANGAQAGAVLVRWRNASDNTVMELSAQTVQPGMNEPVPLWMYSAHDWVPGRYRVEVISPDPSLQLLAAGDFEIAGPNAPLTPFSFEASRNLP